MENKVKLKLITDAVKQLNIAELTEQNTRMLAYSISEAVDLIVTAKFSEDNQLLQDRLKIYYEYQKNYLNIFKEYKEELKFVQSIQEDLRKERAKFFSETLREVSKSLKETGVEQPTQSKWIAELVGSYTQSLNLSENLVEETSMKTINDINNEIKNVVEVSQDIKSE